MGRQIIELVEVLVDRIEKNGYQQRAREDDIADVYKRLNEAEGQAKHWRQARQDAIAAGELMKAEIATLREQLDEAQAAVTLQRTRIERQRRVVDKVRQMLFKPNRDIEYRDINGLRAAIAELDAQPATVAETAEGGT